uniref:SUMO-conjugating enzyme UBC9 n=1 Tax=Sipha flava TaxID=143950 RepID=A0A2S2R2T9_9HEMI
MSTTAINHLIEQRKEWKKNPLYRFVAKPSTNRDGSLNYMVWECRIPVAKFDYQEDKEHLLCMVFKNDYPLTPPHCMFLPRFLHPNVKPDGTICIPILGDDWIPSLKIRDILLKIYQIQWKPIFSIPVQQEVYFRDWNMSNIAQDTLEERRREWRRDPLFKFVAKAHINSDREMDMFRWKCFIPGKENTPWEGGVYKFTMLFCCRYPFNPPKCIFYPPLFHPNISVDGCIFLPLLDKKRDWTTTISIKQILLAIQEHLANPIISHSKRNLAGEYFLFKPDLYAEVIRKQASQLNTFNATVDT